MARVSRRKDSAAAQAPTVTEKIYDTAIYSRLSGEDNGVGADSLENQIYMLKKHMEGKPEFKLCDVYSDNGKSGTNFDRPDFIRLMEDIRKGKINCIIVKDLSRFGRNYIEAGNYLEKIFPYLGVRFISVNDGYDSVKPGAANQGLMVSLKNLIYDIYAKDISRKISGTFEVKQNKGQYIGDFAPYGYSKDPKNRNRLVINEETAPVVRDIYRMRLEGMGISTIIRKLNDRGIVPPNRYLYEKGFVSNEFYAKTKLWNADGIMRILQSPTYIGNLAQRKSTAAYYMGVKNHKNPKGDWVVIENTHEPIVDSDTFCRVQELMEESRQRHFDRLKGIREKYGDNKENILKGLVTCGDCGARMELRAGTRNKDGRTYAYRYACPNRFRKKGFCSTPNIKDEFVLNGIYQAVRMQVKVAADMQKLIAEIVESAAHKEKQSRIDKEIESIRQNLQRLSNVKCTLYEDYVGKLMTEYEYIYIKRKYEMDAVLMQERLDGLLKEKHNFSATLTSNNKWIAAFRKYERQKHVTREMVVELIECVKVYGHQSIEITYRHQDEYDKLAAFLEVQKRTEVQAV